MPRPPADIATAEPEKALVAKVREVRKSRVKAERAGAYTAVSTLHRVEAGLLADLAAIRSAKPATPTYADPAASMTDEELIAGIVQAIVDGTLPEAAIEAIDSALDVRWNARQPAPTPTTH
jgi:hypothetical protein